MGRELRISSDAFESGSTSFITDGHLGMTYGEFWLTVEELSEAKPLDVKGTIDNMKLKNRRMIQFPTCVVNSHFDESRERTVILDCPENWVLRLGLDDKKKCSNGSMGI